MIAAAREAGVGMMIGGMLETEIAMGFSLHMVSGLNCFRFVDLDTPFFIKRNVACRSPWDASTSKLLIPNGTGIGLDPI
jgi:L-alanine-DL-glutamate epimerase-like enolase superfamily enzyme